MSKQTHRWTEREVFKRLIGPYPSPAFVLLPQVRNGTGYARHTTRTADAIAISVWPSRGLFMDGIEIKVSKADWRNELANPEKSHDIQRCCRHWYVAAPKGIVPVAELPPTWGLIECTKGGTKIAKQAPDLEPEEPDMLFVAAILRAASQSMVPKVEVHNEAEQKAKELAALNECELLAMRKLVSEFEASSGVKLSDPWQAGRIGEAVRQVMFTQGQDPARKLLSMRNMAERVIKLIDEGLEESKQEG